MTSRQIDYGAAAEQKVAAELILRGHIINWSTTDKTPYDMVVDFNGKLSKIQVKGIFTRTPGRAYRCELKGFKNRAYKEHEVDFYVVYIHEYNEYYVIPYGMTSFNRNGKAKQYLNRWELLE